MIATIILILLNVAASIYAWNNEAIYRKWMMNPFRIYHDNQYYRFITSGFIHKDWVHLFFNMFALFSFGMALEYHLSKLVGGIALFCFYGIYVTALIVSDIPTYFKNKYNEYYNSLGASGAVAAIIFACIIIKPLNNIYLYGIPVPGVIFGLLYLGYSYYSAKRNLGNVSHDAHFYGAAFGMVAIIIIHPPLFMKFFEQLKFW